jgi:ectoine/hydroxyectoine ABC transporter permease protein EhuD
VFALEDMWGFLPTLLRGAWITVSVSLLSFFLALILGLILAVARTSRSLPLRVLAACYVQFIRGTPMLLQLFFIYYVLPYAGILLSPFVSGVVGLSGNYAAYMAEVFRAGIQAVPKGQWEAASALGMSRRRLMRRIILPQATRIIIPPLGNFFVSIFKDSALVSVITLRDLTFTAEILAAATFKHFEIFAMVAAIYLAISYPTAKLVGWVESRLEVTLRGARAQRRLS